MKRFSLVIECCCVLLLCAGAACLSHIWKNGALTYQIASVALVVPTISSLLFLCLSFGVPELYAVGRLRFPLNLTLPLIYIATLLLTMTLISRVGLSITKVPDNLAAINVWADRWLLVTTFIAGVICLSVLGLLDKDDPRRDGGGEESGHGKETE